MLTTLVNNHVYPEPLYGENNRPEVIPESLARTSYWYRTLIDVPKSYKNHRIWLNFDGINYSAAVWVNGVQVGAIRGAFIRGIFDITANVKPGKKAVLAVLVTPQPHPGISHEHILRTGLGQNGGESAIDGPTFLCALGWDWIPAIRDRDTGIWQKVFLSATRPGGAERSAGDDRSSPAPDRLNRCGCAGDRREYQRPAAAGRGRKEQSKTLLSRSRLNSLRTASNW